MVKHDFKESTWSGKQVYSCTACNKRTLQCQNFDQGEECRGMACGGEGLLTYVASLVSKLRGLSRLLFIYCLAARTRIFATGAVALAATRYFAGARGARNKAASKFLRRP
jgi:hypothetical protein